MRNRKCFKVVDEQEILIEFNELKVDDTFRLTEDGERVVTETGKSTFVAMSHPYKNSNGAWTIDIG